MGISEVSFWTPIFDGTHNGFSYAGLKLAQALERQGIKVIKNDYSEVAIAFTPPYLYEDVDADYIIGYTPWETTEIPVEWYDHIEYADELWTTSHFCKEVLSKYTNKKIDIVLHGVDPSDFKMTKRNLGRPGQQKEILKFLHIGEPAEHKGGQLVADAYNEVFGRQNDVMLTMKGIEFISARNREPFGPVTLNRQIHKNVDVLSVYDLNALMNNHHCLVYPSHGEGFGLIPLQAMFTGLPTILTPWSGMKEFSNYGIELEYELGPTGPGFYQGLGNWAEPSFDDLCEKMLMVYNEYGRYFTEAYMNAQKLRGDIRFSWDSIASQVVKLLNRR